MIILVILTAIVIVGLVTLLSLFLGNAAPNRKQLDKTLDKLREDMRSWMGELTPIDQEELELFSLGQDKQTLRHGVTTTAKGIFTTIYHEPVVAYSYRRFIGPGTNDVLLAQTSAHEYIFHTRKGKTMLYIDGQEVGSLDASGRLIGKRTKKELAKVNRETPKLLPVSVGGREVGSLVRPKNRGDKDPQERAFQFLRNDLSDKEEQLFLSLAVREMVERTVQK